MCNPLKLLKMLRSAARRRGGAAVALLATVCGATTLVLAPTVPLALAPRLAAAAQPAEDAKAIAELAKRRYQEGQFDIAARLYLKAYELAKRPPLLFNCGRAREAAGQKVEAVAIYQQYIAVEKDVAGREEARARIEALGGDARTPEPPPKSDSGKKDSAKKDAAPTVAGKVESAKSDAAKSEPTKPEPAKSEAGKGPWVLDKAVPFDRSGVTKVGLNAGPLLITEVLAKRVPTAGDIAKATADDPEDTFHPVLQVTVTNSGTSELAFGIAARFETADGRVTIGCDSKDSIDAGEQNNHTTLCTLTTMKVADWLKVSRVRVVANVRVR